MFPGELILLCHFHCLKGTWMNEWHIFCWVPCYLINLKQVIKSLFKNLVRKAGFFCTWHTCMDAHPILHTYRHRNTCPTRSPCHTTPFTETLFTILLVRLGSKISKDNFTYMCSLHFVFLTALHTLPQWEEKRKPRWEFFWYFHCFSYETNKPYAIMGIRDGIWGTCQFWGEHAYVCVCLCVLFSARVTIADNSK